MKTVKILLLAITFASTIAIFSQTKEDDFKPRDSDCGVVVFIGDQRGPGAVLNSFIEALNTCDLEKTMALFSDNATAFFPFEENSKLVEGKEKIRKDFKEFYDSVREGKTGPKYMNIKPQDVEIQLSGKTAVVSFQIVSGPVTSRRTFVMRKSRGRWLIIHLHASNIRVEEKP